jgi:hypothetical protein
LKQTRTGADANKYILLRKSRPKKSCDINYIIKSHTQQVGCKYISFLEKVKTEKEPRYNILYIIKSHTQQGGCKHISFLEKVDTSTSSEKKPRYIIKNLNKTRKGADANT